MAAHTDLKKFLTKKEKYHYLDSRLILYCSVASAFVNMYGIEEYITTDVFIGHLSPMDSNSILLPQSQSSLS